MGRGATIECFMNGNTLLPFIPQILMDSTKLSNFAIRDTLCKDFSKTADNIPITAYQLLPETVKQSLYVSSQHKCRCLTGIASTAQESSRIKQAKANQAQNQDCAAGQHPQPPPAEHAAFSPPPEEEEEEEEEEAEEEEEEEEYPSAYQPPPLSWKEFIDINFFTDAPHSGHSLNGASLIFC